MSVTRARVVGRHAFASLSRRAQLSRLRRLGRTALASYELDNARLTLLRFEHNTTFRVDASNGRYLLRINRPQVHGPDTIASEMAWLTALRRDTDIGVPEPVAARDGSLVLVGGDTGVPEARSCVLLRWLDGRFVNRGLVPVHLRRVGLLAGRLQEQAATWAPPAGFLRPRVDTLTSQGKIDSISPSAAAALDGEHPSAADADRAIGLVEALFSRKDATILEKALEVVWATTQRLAEETSAFGLIHGDLHHENFLFDNGEARAIDFDDCGWGFSLYDLAVTLFEIEDRPRYDELCDALLGAYATTRRLPPDYAMRLDALLVLRRMQILLWIIESREHAAFRDEWRRWARDELDTIAAAIPSERVAARRR
jgi:Ser/Thr protein kinase RdoA (MazF antagonist)